MTQNSLSSRPLRIVFDGHSGIGDTMQYIAALASLRAMYPQAQILFTTNSIGETILGLCNFVDRIDCVWNYSYNKNEAIQNFIQQTKYFTVDKNVANTHAHEPINDTSLPYADIIICAERDKQLLKAASSIGAKVITFHTLRAFLYKNTPYQIPFSRANMHEMVRYQRLIRACDPQRFKQTFVNLDLQQIKLTPPKADQAFIDQSLKDKYAIHQYQHLIIINPLSLTQESKGLNLHHEDYVALGEHLAALYPQCLFFLSSYGQQKFHEIPLKAPNLKLFINQGSILSLLALIKRSSLLISPSTGSAHFADNQNVDLCGFYFKTDVKHWGAHGYQQLYELQASMRGTIAPNVNHCSYTIIKKDLKRNYEEYRQKFFKLCTNFIATHTLKLPRKLEQIAAFSATIQEQS